MLDRKEVLIQRNVEFSRKDLLRVKGVVVPKLRKNFLCLSAGASNAGSANT